MSTRQIPLDLARYLRASAPPLLTLGVLTLARTANAESPMSAAVDEPIGVAWRAAAFATLVWFLVAVSWTVNRPWRDRRAFQRLQHLREIATAPDRALVHVQTTVWSSTAGQHLIVVNVATGTTSRVWLPETTVPIAAFVVLERSNGGVNVVDSMNAHQVEAGHRHEQRHVAPRPSRELRGDLPERDDRDDARQLIEETERFLKEQEPRC